MKKTAQNNNKIVFFLKTHAITFVVGCLLALVIFNPSAKPWILERLVSVGLFKATIDKYNSIKSGQAVDNFYYKDMSGRIISVSSLKGQVVFINFWASWCPPCRAEMPSINSLYLKFKNDKRITFLFFNEEDDKTRPSSYIEKNHFSIPLINTVGNIPEKLFNGSLPTTIVLDKDGKMVYKHEGMAGYDTEEFIKNLNQLF